MLLIERDSFISFYLTHLIFICVTIDKVTTCGFSRCLRSGLWSIDSHAQCFHCR